MPLQLMTSLYTFALITNDLLSKTNFAILKGDEDYMINDL